MTGRHMKIRLEPEVLRWARERVGIDQKELARRMQVKLEVVSDWECSGRISVAQADKLAKRTHTPLGFLYLVKPPEDRLPITDFRTRNDDLPKLPSPDLLETVYLMQRRQLWMRDELIEYGIEPLSFVGAFGPDYSPQQVAIAMGETLRLTRNWTSNQANWTSALRKLRENAEDAGVLVVFNGIVGNNTHRKLNPEEFQGFCLADDYAPLIFVNASDFKAAQMFTLAHELAHIFVGKEGVSRFENLQPPSHDIERFCNRAAAEFLVPEDELYAFWSIAEKESDPYQSIANQFKVSTLVAARRTLDLDLIDKVAFFEFYERHEWRRKQKNDIGSGNFWSTQRWRIGPRFAAAVVRAVREGRLSYREAYGLTGLHGDTFEAMLEKMEIVL